MTKDEALDLALEALEELQPDDAYPYSLQSKAITAIKQARSAPVQEPVAYRSRLASGSYTYCNTPQFFDNAEPLYTAAPAARRQWTGLTDEEAAATAYKGFDEYWTEDCKGSEAEAWAAAGRAIEAKLKEKNGLHRQHVIDGSPCWCEPETSYTNPETGASVIVHKEPQ